MDAFENQWVDKAKPFVALIMLFSFGGGIMFFYRMMFCVFLALLYELLC